MTLIINLLIVVIRSLIHMYRFGLDVIAREDQGEFDTFLQFFSLVLSQELDLVTSLIINICIVVIRSLVHIELDWISLLREIWGNLILIHQSRTLVLDHKLSLVTLIFPNQ